MKPETASNQAGAAPGASPNRMPAEWESQAATWLAWPHNETDWPGCFDAIEDVFARIIAALTEFERVRLIAPAPAGRAAERLRRAGADSARIDWIDAQTNRSWTRDFVPSFVRHGAELRAVKWQFNGWSRYDDWQLDESAGVAAAEWRGVPIAKPTAPHDGTARRVVFEGGAFDVDGEGTLITSETCWFGAPFGRNRWLDHAAAEAVLRDALGVTRVLWVGDGIEGDDTFGHVDDFVRFVSPGRIVLAEELRATDANYRPLQEARERLQGAKDACGRTLEVIGLPMPEPVYFDGQRLPASYANFYLANEQVLVPVFDDPMDARALGILAELFADRRMISIPARQLVVGLGTVHCSTQQEPAVAG